MAPVTSPAGSPEPGIDAHAAREPDRPALVCGDRRCSFGDLRSRSTALAAALADRGAAPGDRVAVMLANSIEVFETWCAIGRLRADPVLVNWHLKRDELAHILRDSGARALVAAASLHDQWAEAARERGCPVLVVADGRGPAGDHPGDDYEAAIAAAGPAAERPLELLPAPVFYTSGTTGKPKGVVHGSFAEERARMAQQAQLALWGWRPDDVYLVSGPAYHAGPGGFAMSALYVGATTVILPWFDSRAWLAAVDAHRVTLSFMVPAHFIRILEVPAEERAAHDLSSLRLIVHGGAPCPVPVKRRIIEALPSAEVWELYGMSEGGATRISPQEWLERPGSVGQPWPGTEVLVVGDDRRELPPGEQGLVYVRPAGGARFHYHDDPAKTDSAWRGDAFTVGDIGYLDGDGYLYLTDRASDMVMRGGVNVYPREIEDVLFTHPAVVDCAVFGVPDERLGERLRAVVELRVPASDEELREHVRARLADYKVPAEVVVVDELPRHPNGKVLKRLLREQAWAGHDRRIG
jgi:long-chain acyl-CoA synthetase